MTVDFEIGFWPRSLVSDSQSLPRILRRVANPVEPLGFKFVSNHPPSSLLDGVSDSLGKRAGLFDQLEDGQANAP
jgi:hypothetical protein